VQEKQVRYELVRECTEAGWMDGYDAAGSSVARAADEDRQEA